MSLPGLKNLAGRLLSVALVLLAPGARAEADWFGTLYTPKGVELRTDERIFALYGLLNALGYDAGPTVRAQPFPKPRLHPVRSQVRQALAGLDKTLRLQAEAYLDAHPSSLERYLAYTVMGPKAVPELSGLDALLQRTSDSGNTAQLLASHQFEYRALLRSYLPALDGPWSKAKTLLRQGGSTRLAVVANLLEAEGQAMGVGGEGEVVVMVGPSEKPNVEGVLREFARVAAGGSLAPRASAWSQGPAVLKEAQRWGAGEGTPAEYAAAVVGRAVALRALDAPDASYERAAQAGYFATKDVAARLDDTKPMDTWLFDAIARAAPPKTSQR